MEKNELRRCFPEKTEHGCDFEWHSFGTLSTALSQERAKKLLIRWFAEVRHYLYPNSIEWVAVFEMHRFGHQIHIHVLVGGLKARHRDTWAQRWTQIAAGRAWLYKYRDRQDFLEYIESQTVLSSYFETEFDLRGQQSPGWNYPAFRERAIGDRFEKLF